MTHWEFKGRELVNCSYEYGWAESGLRVAGIAFIGWGLALLAS